ncbi:MAG TPA: transglutaminaseTgpA domain-containing protein [Ilumatobacter sp.]|nr:transglutaminaseTgpA domain-containing protein [Ilumatobacter sp.]
MTATLRSAPGAAPRRDAPGAPTAKPTAEARRPLRPLGRDLAATLALIGYSAAVAAGFARVFSGWSFLTDLLVLVVVPHALSFGLRRARLNGWVATPLVGLVALWLMLGVCYRDTFTGPFPTSATWRLLDTELDLVRAQFPTAIAPVIYDVGWAAIATFAVALVVVLADTFAFRAHARGEALVPGLVLFVFVAALGSDRLRAALTALLVAAGVVAVVALRQYHDTARQRARTAGDQRRPMSLLAPAAAVTAVAVAGVAAYVGPRLPGAEADALYDTRGRGGGVTEVLSPLVDIRSRLTNRSDNELFRVNADREAYWRQTTLPEFDGSRFGLPSRDLERIQAGEAFDPANGNQVRQQIQVIGLGGQLVPAAADPVQASGARLGGAPLELRLNRDTSTLLTPSELDTGDLFTVVSASPTLTPDVLRAAGSANPPDAMFLGLPDDFPGNIAEVARAVVGDAATSYDQVLALQTWFRSNFDYSTEVQAGHSIDAIESFLRIRVGYCEQFAVSLAAMARTLGIPSRVAVGFTPGVLGSDGWYTVRGRNAHAWPEIWFDDIGWVPFEPTPGRGAPGAESYTGVPPTQDETPGGPGGEVDGPAVERPTTPATVVPPPGAGTGPGATTTTTPQSGRGPNDPDNLTAGGGSGTSTPPPAGDGATWWPYAVGGLAALALVAPWLVRRVRRGRSQGRVQRIVTAWARARGAAMGAGVPGTPAMTAQQWAAATADVLPVAARPMTSLAEAVDRVTFARPDSVDIDHAGSFGETLGDDCELWSDQVVRVADDLLPWHRKLLRYFTRWN